MTTAPAGHQNKYEKIPHHRSRNSNTGRSLGLHPEHEPAGSDPDPDGNVDESGTRGNEHGHLHSFNHAPDRTEARRETEANAEASSSYPGTGTNLDSAGSGSADIYSARHDLNAD